MKKFWRSSYFALIMLFIYVPVVVMIVFSFNSGNTTSIFNGGSTKWYTTFFNNTPFVKSIITSLFVAIVATVISVIIGTMAAIGLSKCRKATQKAWFGIANIPLINADIVTAVSLMMVYILVGVHNFGIGTLLLAHISFDVPYVLITVMPRLRKVDKSMIEAAQDLGAKPYQVLFRVILPVLRPAIITAAAIAFAMSFDDFVISYFTGGAVTNVSTFIYTLKNVKPYIFAFGTFLVAALVFIIVCWNTWRAVNMRIKETKEQIKKGSYKGQYLNRLNEKLSKDYVKLNEKKEIVLSKNPFLWIHYWYLKILIKLYSIKNFDKQISKLEWRQTKLKNEIRNEKRFYTRLKKNAKSIKAVQKDIAKANISKARLKKLTNRLDSLQDKKDYLESEIEWIENRDEKQERKARRITRRIKQLNKEFKAEFDDLSKKDIAWYRKKIKDLEEWKIEVEEGKAHYKLRMTTEKLRDLKEIRNNKIFALATKAKALRTKVFIWKELGHKFNHKLNAWRGRNDSLYANILVAKDRYISRNLRKIEWQVIKNENKISATNNEIVAKREKYFPSEGQNGKPKNWLSRSWKWLAIIFVAAGAFSGLTVAYVKENTYDLTIGNWGEYIDMDLINKFQKQYNIKVNYQNYNSNEDLYTKLNTYQYDVMVPSDYMVQRLAEENKIQKLDWNRFTDINNPLSEMKWDASAKSWNVNPKNDPKYDAKKEKVNPALIGLMSKSPITVGKENDTLVNYAMPYFWGDISLVFNTQKADVRSFLQNALGDSKADVQGKDLNNNGKDSVGLDKQLSWGIVQKAEDEHPDWQIRLQDDTKNLFMIADQALYGHVNFKQPGDTEGEWKDRVNKASDYVKHLMDGKNVTLEGDTMYNEVENGTFDVAMMYSGDLLRVESDKLGKDATKGPYPYSFVRPYTKKTNEKDGERTNVYTDNLTIGSGVKGKTLQYAYDFLDFMFNAKNAEDNSEYVGLDSPNLDAGNAAMDDQDYSEYQRSLYQPIIAHNGDFWSGTSGDDYNSEPLAYQNNMDVDEYVTGKDPRNH